MNAVLIVITVVQLLVALALAVLAAGWWFTGGDLTALPQLLGYSIF